MADEKKYEPITIEEAVKLALAGRGDRRKEISDLKALIIAVESAATQAGLNMEDITIRCKDWRIIKADCDEMTIRCGLVIYQSTFSGDANFRDATFSGRADFRHATFTKDADFRSASFSGDADFRSASFSGYADFSDAKFREAAIFLSATFSRYSDFSDAKFSVEALFSDATFSGNANFIDATFSGDVDFESATFSGNAKFWDTTFSQDATLSGNLSGADFNGSKFNHCKLSSMFCPAILDQANLEHTQGLILDANPIRNAKFSPRASDPWSQLRRAYTGPYMIISLVFLVAFFMPYVLKTVGWVGANRVQEELTQHIKVVNENVAALDDVNHKAAQSLDVVLEAVKKRLPDENSKGWQQRSVLASVLSLDKHWMFWLTPILLLLYNICRALLTWIVAPMRDAEERSGVSPPLQAQFV